MVLAYLQKSKYYFKALELTQLHHLIKQKFFLLAVCFIKRTTPPKTIFFSSEIIWLRFCRLNVFNADSSQWVP